MAGSPGAAVIDQLAPQPGDLIVPKRYYSAFTQTDLDATCRVHGISRLVVTGQHTDCCSAYQLRRLRVRHQGDRRQRRHCCLRAVHRRRYQQAQDDALHYLRTYYGAEVTSTAALV